LLLVYHFVAVHCQQRSSLITCFDGEGRRAILNVAAQDALCWTIDRDII
jgi:hypothetical protein